MPNESRFSAHTYQIRRGSLNLECYYFRYRHYKGWIRRMRLEGIGPIAWIIAFLYILIVLEDITILQTKGSYFIFYFIGDDEVLIYLYSNL